MVFYKIAFGMCLLLLFFSYVALAAAQKRRDQRRVRVLYLFRGGLALSASSYLLRLLGTPPHSQFSFFSFVTCLLGTTFLWLGFIEHWKLRSGRSDTRSVPPEEEDEPVSEALRTPSPVPGSSSLTARAYQVVLYAQYEAYRRQECCVDTDHLLLGLLHDNHSAGVRILDILGISSEKVHLEMLGQMAARRKFVKQRQQGSDQYRRVKASSPTLTQGAQQVFTLAAQEAHRFDKASVGTEHLLLGLVLMGKGKAAAVLFGEGVTVDGIRNEILKAKKAA